MPRTPRQYFRWLLVQFGLFDKAAFRFAIDEIRPQDTFIVSFPKSGNTWLRFLIAHLISGRNDISFRNIDELVPDIYTSASLTNKLSSPRFIKTHNNWFADFPKSIYIVRDYRDVLVSYYHYQLAAKEFSGSFRDYIRTIDSLHPFGKWKAHVESALAFQSRFPARIHLMRYEDLLASPDETLEKLVQFLGITPKRSVAEAIAHCAFSRLQKTESEKGSLFHDISGQLFFREGKSGGWKNSFSEDDLRFVLDENGELLKKLGYENA